MRPADAVDDELTRAIAMCMQNGWTKAAKILGREQKHNHDDAKVTRRRATKYKLTVGGITKPGGELFQDVIDQLAVRTRQEK